MPVDVHVPSCNKRSQVSTGSAKRPGLWTQHVCALFKSSDHYLKVFFSCFCFMLCVFCSFCLCFYSLVFILFFICFYSLLLFIIIICFICLCFYSWFLFLFCFFVLCVLRVVCFVFCVFASFVCFTRFVCFVFCMFEFILFSFDFVYSVCCVHYLAASNTLKYFLRVKMLWDSFVFVICFAVSFVMFSVNILQVDSGQGAPR